MNDLNNKKIKKIVTHSGNFHTDEVFACAVISILCDDAVEIIRSRSSEVWVTGDFVLDVGGVYDPETGHFDHHQIGGGGVRQNGIPYSSFGLVWKQYGEQIAGSAYGAKTIDQRITQSVDAGDNGVEIYAVRGEVSPYFLNDVVSAFRPSWNESQTEDEGFFEAFEIAKKILRREIIHVKGEEEGKRLVEKSFQDSEDKRIIVLENHYPWYEVLASHSEPLFVVKPDRGGEGKWKVEAVRGDTHSFKNKKDLPAEWAGKIGQELAQITGVPDALFCHNKRFIAIAGSKEGAMKLAKRAVDA